VKSCFLHFVYVRIHSSSFDWQYFLNYWSDNPYRICNRYFRKEEKKEVFYGDSWPFTIPYFVDSIPISKEDVFFDLGSGTGRISFWFQVVAKCKVVAIEKVPHFIQKAKIIQKKVQNEKVDFIEEDLLETNYDSATIIYFYSSSFDDKTILKLIEKWKSLPTGVRIITTSFALAEYGSKDYKVLKQFKVSYPWGMCDVFLQIKL